MATGRNFSMSAINSGHHYLPTYQILMISDNVECLRYCGSHFENGDQYKFFTAQIQHCSISTSWIDSQHWKISTGLHFQNGHHNTAKIQHCPILSKFYMWVDNDVPNDIGQCWIFTAHFHAVLAAILIMADILKILTTQNCSSNGDLSLCQILCLYHYSFRSYQH
jgi:hypothetical protein